MENRCLRVGMLRGGKRNAWDSRRRYARNVAAVCDYALYITRNMYHLTSKGNRPRSPWHQGPVMDQEVLQSAFTDLCRKLRC